MCLVAEGRAALSLPLGKSRVGIVGRPVLLRRGRYRLDQGRIQHRAALQDEASILQLAIQLSKQLLQKALFGQLVPEAVQNRMIGRGILKAQTNEAVERRAASH